MEVLQHRAIHPIIGDLMQVDDGGEVDFPLVTVIQSVPTAAVQHTKQTFCQSIQRSWSEFPLPIYMCHRSQECQRRRQSSYQWDG
jgi:hypothetical protein